MTQPIHHPHASGRRQNRRRSAVRKTAFLLMTLVTTDVSAQQKPTTGYAPVNGLNMYYEVHGGGDPVVLLHGAFMTITNNWAGWISELFTHENLAADVAALLKHLTIARADLIGYSMGGAVAMQSASSPRPRKGTTSEPTSLRPPRVARSTATSSRAPHRDWPPCPTPPTSHCCSACPSSSQG